MKMKTRIFLSTLTFLQIRLGIENFKTFKGLIFDTHEEANRMAREAFCKTIVVNTGALNAFKAFAMETQSPPIYTQS